MWPEREKITQGTWSSPVTNRLLFEAGVSSFSSKWGGYIPPGSQTGLVAVTEQSTAAGVLDPNFTYRGWNSAASNNQQHNVWRASLAYVTGAHSFKVGYQAAYEVYRQVQNVDNQLSYTFNNGTPTQFTMRIGPHIQSNRTRYDGFYAQDQWTHGVSRCRPRCDTSTRGAGSPRMKTASPPTTGSAAATSSRGRKA